MSDAYSYKSFSTPSSVSVHIGEHESRKKPYGCDVCKKSFARSDTLSVHKSTHTGMKPYECDVCKKRFSQSSNLSTHKKMVHTREKRYECDVCKKGFSFPSTLSSHKRTHTGEKPYEYDICKKRFSQLCGLSKHKRTHTGEKPYECDICKKRFSESSNLSRHKRTHTGEKPYECHICKKRFSQSGLLLYHKKTHSKETFHRHKKPHLLCNNCGRELTQAQDLQEYFHKDESIDKYVCDECSKNFCNFARLVCHIARHHGGKRDYQCGLCKELQATQPTGTGYICFVCDVVFDIARDLEDHIATHDTLEHTC